MYGTCVNPVCEYGERFPTARFNFYRAGVHKGGNPPITHSDLVNYATTLLNTAT